MDFLHFTCVGFNLSPSRFYAENNRDHFTRHLLLLKLIIERMGHVFSNYFYFVT